MIAVMGLAAAAALAVLFLLGFAAQIKSRIFTHKDKEIMENNTNTTPQNGQKKSGRVWLKLGLIFIISLLLLIPQAIIQNMISERQFTETEASMDVSQKWGTSQQVLGPVIFIPGDKPEHNIYLLPEALGISGDVATKRLSRGIFDFSVFEAELKMSGHFSRPKELTAAQLSHINMSRAQLLFAIEDFAGFQDYPALTYCGAPAELNAEGLELGGCPALSCPVDAGRLLAGGDCPFEMSVRIKGSDALEFVPAGRTTSLHIASDCATPSFDGRYLPAERQVADTGFTADWKVLALNRDFPQVLKSQKDLLGVGTIDVQLKVPVEQYLKTTRCIKYAYLIIILTFAVVFFVENKRRANINPIQYALVGIALILFYTLLLSFSEHLSFLLSYLIASVMTIGLITAFVRALVKNNGAALAVGGLLAALYLFIYIIMQLESYALLVGSLGVFAILAVAMFASRKINWN